MKLSDLDDGLAGDDASGVEKFEVGALEDVEVVEPFAELVCFLFGGDDSVVDPLLLEVLHLGCVVVVGDSVAQFV